jgi:hypothetical protein
MGEIWSAPMLRKTAAAKSAHSVRWYFSAWLEASITRYSMPDRTAWARWRWSSRGSGVVMWDSKRSTPSQVSMEEIRPHSAPPVSAMQASRMDFR